MSAFFLRKISLPFLLVLLPLGLCADGPKHFLWRVRSEKATVYLLGSLHMQAEHALALPDVVEQSFKASRYVAFETDLTRPELQGQMAEFIAKNFMYGAGDELLRHLSQAQWRELKVALAKHGLGEAEARRMKPIMLAMLLSVGDLKNSGLQEEKGIDEIYLKKAQAQGKTIFGLETWSDPLKSLAGLSDKEQVDYLMATLKDSNQVSQQVQEITKAWQEGDTAKLDEITNQKAEPEWKPLMDKLLRERNSHWVLYLDKILRSQGTYFIVVGAGHLVGRFGLPNWLKFRGFRVEQL